MSRIARIVVDGLPYHITQRGNGRQQVFFSAEDHRVYLDLLRVYSVKSGLRVEAYCLMPNHVHLVAVPERPESMASALGRTHADYARYFNLKRRSCGHVWQARFFSCPLEAGHFWRAIAYVERNPVRAAMVERAEDYRWSSARARFEGSNARGFVEVLQSNREEEEFGRCLAEASRRGRALGDGKFVEELERRTSRMLRPRPAGRPRKVREEQEQLSLEIGV